ncbi:hypothetical protein [Geodermatophilus sp. CPCC 206100]|uniref:hypothetical protein n=1 Tax=Geodermatophilus sp. CPCC 206100 TaxID=3020054 RepID=UPI003AFFF96B
MGGTLLLPGVAGAETSTWVAPVIDSDKTDTCEGTVALTFSKATYTGDATGEITYWVKAVAAQGDGPGNPGDGSAGTGEGSTGTGEGSTGTGEGSTGTGEGSTGTGEGSTGTGEGSTGTGEGSTGTGEGSTGTGEGSTGTGEGSTGTGEGSTGTGEGSTGTGEGSTGTGEVPLIEGDQGSGTPVGDIELTTDGYYQLTVVQVGDVLTAKPGDYNPGDWYDFTIQARVGDDHSAASAPEEVQISADECAPVENGTGENGTGENGTGENGTGENGTGTTPEKEIVPVPVPVTEVPATPGTPQVPAKAVVPTTAPSTPFTLTTDKGKITEAAPGQQVTIIGTGFAPNSTVTVIIYSEPQVLGTALTDANGNFQKAFTVPANLPAGQHSLVASGLDANGQQRFMRMDVTVAAAGTATGAKSGDNLAYTGAEPLVPALLGLGALAVGVSGWAAWNAWCR